MRLRWIGESGMQGGGELGEPGGISLFVQS